MGLVEQKIVLSSTVNFHSSVSFGNSIRTGYEIFDDEPTDQFTIDVGTDPIFGTPIFREGGASRSSFPLEHGTTDYYAPEIGEPSIDYNSDGIDPSPSESDQPVVTVEVTDASGNSSTAVTAVEVGYLLDYEPFFSRRNRNRVPRRSR